jgi:two-component sensor histidine kinase
VWRESEGPLVVDPSRNGFGNQLIKRGLVMELDAEVSLDYAPPGLVFTLTVASRPTTPVIEGGENGPQAL